MGEEAQTPNTTPRVEAVPTGNNPLLHDPSPELADLTTKMKAAIEVMKESKAEDTARWETADAERKATGEKIQALMEKQEAEARAKATDDAVQGMKDLLSQTRSTSKAGDIGGNTVAPVAPGASDGRFLGAVMGANSNDHEAQMAAKATLRELGVAWSDVPPESKATLGSTDATGGYIIPNNVVAELMAPQSYLNPYRSLVTTVNGVTVGGVDLPWKSALGAVAAVIAWGDTKTNADLTYNSYTATMYTLAKIHDISKQFARQSQGAAEQDVLQELAQAFAKGEATYIVDGTGSSQPYGFRTAVQNAPAAFTSAFTAAATLAGSISKAIATAAGALAGRDVNGGLTAVLNSADYWDVLSEGATDAGFYYAPTVGPPGLPKGTLMFRDIPIIGDSLLTSPELIVGQFKALKAFYGQSYRVDSSDVAGTRWDKNIIGFRGEMEMGFDARPAVFAGRFQYIADVVE